MHIVSGFVCKAVMTLDPPVKPTLPRVIIKTGYCIINSVFLLPLNLSTWQMAGGANTWKTLMTTSTLCCFMCRYWTSTFLPISGKFELRYESLTRRVYSALVFFFFLSVSSSLCMFIHIKWHQRPAYTLLSNKHQARSRYNWLAQMLPASSGQLYNRERPASWIMMKWHHGLAWVLRFKCSCLSSLSTMKPVDSCTTRNSMGFSLCDLQDQLNLKVY